MENFWIIGGGKFGLRAARTLRKIDAARRITIVEKRKSVCGQLDGLGFDAVCTDGIQYLERHLSANHLPAWVVPAIPLHVAFE
ncbi:MAG: NAD-binding protein, partial [Desulfobacterales bacterium]